MKSDQIDTCTMSNNEKLLHTELTEHVYEESDKSDTSLLPFAVPVTATDTEPNTSLPLHPDIAQQMYDAESDQIDTMTVEMIVSVVEQPLHSVHGQIPASRN